jgi:hypothetical protein
MPFGFGAKRSHAFLIFAPFSPRFTPSALICCPNPPRLCNRRRPWSGYGLGPIARIESRGKASTRVSLVRLGNGRERTTTRPIGGRKFSGNVQTAGPPWDNREPLSFPSATFSKCPSSRALRGQLTAWCVLSSGPLQAHFFYPGTQSSRLHPQKLGSSINTFDFPAGLPQDSKSVLSLTTSHFCFS